MGEVRVGFFWVEIGIVMGSFKHCNEHMGFIKCRGFIV
jgi:hypothetical protein